MNVSARPRKKDIPSSGDVPSEDNYALPTLLDTTMNPGIAISTNRVPTQYGLFESIKHQRYRQALLLVEAGVHINGRNERGQTPLIFACTSVTDNTKLRGKFVQLLLRAGADPNLQDWKGLTALMHGCGLEQLETVMTLAEIPQTDLTIQDQNGETALSYAAAKGNLDIVAVLLNALRQVFITLGPALEHKNLQGQRPTDLAILNHHEDVIKLLNLAADSPEKILEFSLPESRNENDESDVDNLVDEDIMLHDEDLAVNLTTVLDKNHELSKSSNTSELPSIGRNPDEPKEVLKQPTAPKFRNNRKTCTSEPQAKQRSQKSGILPLLSLSSLDVPASEPWEWDVGATGRKVKPGKRGTITGSRSLTDSRGKLSETPIESAKYKLFCLSSDQLNNTFGGFSTLDGTSAPFQRLTSTEYLSNVTNKEGLHLPPIRASLTNYTKMTKPPKSGQGKEPSQH